ncbi:MAG: CHAT domain-containing protein [Chloroflexi bacterium]|nr:MAG: CHAT domain-containing protein [Chloroflexota bacterium]
MGETLSLLFRSSENGTFELQVKENWSGRVVSGSFNPPYTTKQLNALLKKLSKLDSTDQELCEIGQRLFFALCNVETAQTTLREAGEPSGQTILRSLIQRTLKRRGTVALTFCFTPGCDELVRYPWELLHNGDHFLLASGIFTLTRALLHPDIPLGCELPVHLPMRVLYIGASPVDCTPLETEKSFAALENGLAPLIESGQVFLDRLEPPTFGQLVRYLNSYGGAGLFDDNETVIPCYLVHFDGHGAFGRLCPEEDCKTISDVDARRCGHCNISLKHVKAQTYLCFCDDEGYNRFINTEALRELFLSSDVRLTVFSACETATFQNNRTRQHHRRNVVDATLATALVTAQVPAVVAMPFSLQDELSPTFIFHFYEALADGRMLEEALSRARQALLPMQQKSWFIPVLYRHVAEGDAGPVPLLARQDAHDRHHHPLAHIGAWSSFVGRELELQDLRQLFAAATTERQAAEMGYLRLQPRTHHIALTGPAGIGKSALAFEAVRRYQEKFPGGVLGVSLQGGKSFDDALGELIRSLHIPTKINPASNIERRAQLVIATFRSLASRELPCLLLLDGFEEVKDRSELEAWLHFLSSLPQEVVVLVTSRSNPGTMVILQGSHCRWYEYSVRKMLDADLMKLFAELAAASGLDQRIHLDDPQQQAILQEICTLLDGYPLGAELIFGTARTIGDRIYTPQAATRSLEEVRDELRTTPLAGILAALEISYRHLTPSARLLLSYLAAFKLPFSREQIMLVVAPETLAVACNTGGVRQGVADVMSKENGLQYVNENDLTTLAENWPATRDELVQASFMQFDGHVYTIHVQVRSFAISHLPVEERRRVHRVVAAYYSMLPQPGVEEWLAAFEHLESAGELQDIQEALHVAVRASEAIGRQHHTRDWLAMLQRAKVYASRLGDTVREGYIQCCLSALSFEEENLV